MVSRSGKSRTTKSKKVRAVPLRDWEPKPKKNAKMEVRADFGSGMSEETAGVYKTYSFQFEEILA